MSETTQREIAVAALCIKIGTAGVVFIPSAKSWYELHRTKPDEVHAAPISHDEAVDALLEQADGVQ